MRRKPRGPIMFDRHDEKTGRWSSDLWFVAELAVLVVVLVALWVVVQKTTRNSTIDGLPGGDIKKAVETGQF